MSWTPLPNGTHLVKLVRLKKNRMGEPMIRIETDHGLHDYVFRTIMGSGRRCAHHERKDYEQFCRCVEAAKRDGHEEPTMWLTVAWLPEHAYYAWEPLGGRYRGEGSWRSAG